MIKKLALFSLLLIAAVRYSTGQTPYGRTQSLNHVVSRTFLVPGVTETEAEALAPIVGRTVETIGYMDGLMRPLQQVVTKGSAALNDIIQPHRYDSLGREVKHWLPYTSSGVSGSYRSDALNGSGGYQNSAQRSFYLSPPESVVEIGASQVAYSETLFEKSPLGLPLEMGAPGASWKINGGHTVEMGYSTNATGEVRLWNVTSTGAAFSNYVTAGALLKQTVKDENGNATITFKDDAGVIICKKVQSGPNTYFTTDYIYDDLGNLRYVVPPLPAVVTLGQVFSEVDEVFQNFIYGYHHDSQHRVVEKKVPGKDWEYFIYNLSSLPVFTQNAQQRAQGVWMFRKYDRQGRVVMTGEYYTTDDREFLQLRAVGDYGTFETIYGSCGSLERSSEPGSCYLYGYTTQWAFPYLQDNSLYKIYAVNYYDNYDFLDDITINPDAAVYQRPSVGIDSLSQSPSGHMTGQLVNILGTDKYMFSVVHYDDKGRLAKSISQQYINNPNEINHYDVTTATYSFGSQLLQTERKNYINGVQKVRILTRNVYDHAGRLTSLKQSYNGGAETTLANYIYNELGQLRKKELHASAISQQSYIVNLNGNDVLEAGQSRVVSASQSVNLLPGFEAKLGSSFHASIQPAGNLQNINYRYNARGWLSSINNPDDITDESDGESSDVFALQLEYDTPDPAYNGTPAYNGNVSTAKWQTVVPLSLGNSMTQEQQGYAYTYDALNRLTSAIYKASSGNNIFNEQIGYDEIGNITSLNRKGKVPGDVLNNLTYNYDSSTERGNKLLSVNDSGTEGYSSTYSYDADGNVTADSKKQISTISYNYLGLPRMLTFATGKSIEFIYNAAGRKLARIIRQGTTVAESRNYAAGIEYVDYALQFVQTPEGRAVPSGTDYVYEYYLTDHQGNIRALVGDKNNNGQFDQATDLLQVTDYYPFGRQINHGLQLVSNPANNYGFSGKELLGDLGQLDYGARFYDPVVGRWNAADPLADMAADWTPYRYGFNNPIRYTDPSGLYEVENGNIFITDQAEITRFLEYLGEHPEASTKDMSDYVISADNGFAWALKEVTVGGAATYDNAISNAQEQVANVVRSISDFNGSINYGQVDNKGEGYEQTDLHEYSQWGRKVSGYLLAASLPLEQAFKRASLYSPPTSGSTVNIIYEKKILGQRVIHGSLGEMNAIRAGKIANGLKIASKVVGVAGVAFAGADMIRNGVTTSNSLDLAMSGLALSGFGTGVAGTYFLLNAGSIYFTNKDLGQHIDGYIK